jgi:hypothetical protein
MFSKRLPNVVSMAHVVSWEIHTELYNLKEKYDMEYMSVLFNTVVICVGEAF